jgi:hypothetical protein
MLRALPLTQRLLQSVFVLAFCFGEKAAAWSLGDFVDTLVGPSVDDVDVSYALQVPDRSSQSSTTGSSFQNSHQGPSGSGYQYPNYEIPPLLPDLWLFATVSNNSSFYVTAIDIECSLFDEQSNRFAKDVKISIDRNVSMGDPSEFTKPAIKPGGKATWKKGLFDAFTPGARYARYAECTLVSVHGEK